MQTPGKGNKATTTMANETKRVLISWIGGHDCKAAKGGFPEDDPGPVFRLLRHETFDRIYILNDFVKDGDEGQAFRQSLSDRLKLGPQSIVVCSADAGLKNDYVKTYEFTRQKIEAVYRENRSERFSLLISPGAPAAQAAMIVVGQTLLPDPEFLNTFKPQPDAANSTGIERVVFPYNVVYEVVNRALQASLSDPPHSSFDTILGDSDQLQHAKSLASLVATRAAAPAVKLHVLIQGETGTGKELFAEAMHKASPRKDKPFVAVNSAGISDQLLESELFGHKKNAFTGAITDRDGVVKTANGGTLFLDEVGDMPLSMQVKLLRFIQSGEYRPVGADEVERADVWVIAATHKDLPKMVGDREFRQDLYERLNGWTLRLPPLRHRRDDIPMLARRFLSDAIKDADPSKRFSDDALDRLRLAAWPGNVRQLLLVVRRLALFTTDEEIRPEHVDQWSDDQAGAHPKPIRDLEDRELAACLTAAIDALVRRYGENKRFLDAVSSEKGKSLGVVNEIITSILISRAWVHSKRNLSEAAELLGKKSALKTGVVEENLQRFEKEIERFIGRWEDLSILR